MTKAELVEIVFEKNAFFTRQESAKYVDQVFEIMKETP